MTIENDYKKIYLQESEELLGQMNRNLLIIEEESGNKGALDEIFRAAHTLKSMSASMGYAPIADLAHKMENVLDQLRSGTIQAGVELIDVLFKSFDALEVMVGFVKSGKAITKDVSSLLQAMNGVLVKEVEFKEYKVNDEVSLNEFERNTLARVGKEGYFCFHIKVTLDKKCVLKSVRAFMIFRNLHSIGEVIKSFPDASSLEEEKFDQQFGCIFITKQKEKIVKAKVMEVLDVDRVEVEAMEIDYPHIEEIIANEAKTMRKIQSVRVDIVRLDKLMNLVEELAIAKLRLVEVSNRFKDISLTSVVEQCNRIIDDLQLEVMQVRLVPVGQIFERFPRLVRDLVKKEGKKVKFDVVGGDIELDRTVLDEIGDPLIHLLRNAVDHGVESPEERKKGEKSEEAKITLLARRDKNHVFIEVEDDGRGMDPTAIKKAAIEKGLITEDEAELLNDGEALLLTAVPAFSTRTEVTEVSGRGVGLDVVKKKTESLGGGIVIDSKLGEGTKITMRLPMTTAVIKALLTQAMQRVFVIPTSNILEIISVRQADIKLIEHCETILHRKKIIPIVRLDLLFKKDGEPVATPVSVDLKLNVVVLEFGNKKFGVVVDKLIDQQNVVVKQLAKELRGVKGLAGATILGDGSVALVLDVATLV